MVYFIESNGYLKVGYTSDITKRMKQYATHNPSFELLYVISGDEKLERQIQDELKDYHYRLEWFHIDDYVRYMIDYLREKYKDWKEDEVSVQQKMRKMEDKFLELLLSSMKDTQNIPCTKYYKQKWAKELKTPLKNIDSLINKLMQKDLMFTVTTGIYGINESKLLRE